MSEKEVQNNVSPIKWFSEISRDDLKSVGVKAAFLSELHNNKIKVPSGFVITSSATEEILAPVRSQIDTLLKETNISDLKQLEANSEKIQSLINQLKIPESLKESIEEAYEILDVDKQVLNSSKNQHNETALDILKVSHEPPFVAVRSSPISENPFRTSLAGNQESYLNVKGKDELLDKMKQSISSFYSPQSILYRSKHSEAKSSTALIVQNMINSEKSGVMFSRNPIKNEDSIILEAIWGLGEGIVSGKIIPDNYIMSSSYELISKKSSDKQIALTRNSSGKTDIIKLTPERSKHEVLTGHELKILSQLAKQIEDHFKSPQNIEFAISEGEFYITQSRPLSEEIKVSPGEVEGNVLISGFPASPGIATGKIKIINSTEDLDSLKSSDVAVVKYAKFAPFIKASAIITDNGGISSHAATILREKGIPLISGTYNATQSLIPGKQVTVDAFTGKVIDGANSAQQKEEKILPAKQTKTKIKLSINSPDHSEKANQTSLNEIGLIRIEALIAETGKHPAWYVKNSKVPELIQEIHNSLKAISQNFNQAWIKLSDFHSNKHSHLEDYPNNKEDNPLMGDHGIRFALKNQELLEAELKAIKELADEFPEKEFGLMIPHVSSVEEVRELKSLMQSQSISDSIKIGISLETPAAVQIINDICEEGIDFLSINVPLITQHTLAIDKSNENVKHLYSENNPAILNTIRYIIRRCKKYKVQTSTYGHTTKNLTKFLIENGIDSITLAPQDAHKVSNIISEIEFSTHSETTQKNSDVPKQNISHLQQEPPTNQLQISPIENNNESKAEKTDSSDEDAILAALGETPDADPEKEDDYQPSVEHSRNEDVPSLNDAIPVESDIPQQNLQHPKNISFEEEEQEAVFEQEIQQEIANSEVRAQAIKKLTEQSQQSQNPESQESEEETQEDSKEDQVLNIF